MGETSLPRRPLVRLARLVAVLALAAVPAAARADATIDFEHPAAGTTLTTQYANVGGTGKGITFAPLPGGAPAPTYTPRLAAAPGQAQSGTQVANVANCPICEIYVPTLTGTFAQPKRHVSVRVGLLGPAAPACTAGSTAQTCVMPALTAYDANGTPLAHSAPVTVTQGAGVHTLLQVSTATSAIVGIAVTMRDTDVDESLAADDLAYDTPAGGGSPDFTLTPAATFVPVRQGATTTDAIAIGRIGGSHGPVVLSLTGTLPQGVHATISPDPAPGTSASLALRVDPDAPPTPGAPVTVTLRGSPASAAVGPADRTVKLSIDVRSSMDLRVLSPHDVDLSSCVGNVALEVDRDLGFPGPVDLTVTGLAGGVTGSFTPSKATFPNGERGEPITLVLTAPASGAFIPQQTLIVHATAPGLAERTVTLTAHGICPQVYDLRVTGMQITQGTQSTFLPTPDPAFPKAPVEYGEIPDRATIVVGRPTVVRVYADEAVGPAGGVPQAYVVLTGYTYDRLGRPVPFPGGPLLPVDGPGHMFPGPAAATPADEVSGTAAYSFVLPTDWVRGRFAVTAHVVGPQPGQTTPSLTPCTSTQCTADDDFAITQIPTTLSHTIFIAPVAMTVAGAPPLPGPESVFAFASLASAAPLHVFPYVATIDISDLASLKPGSDQADDAVLDRLDDYNCDNAPSSDTYFDVGVNTGLARGETHTHTCFWEFERPSDAVVEFKRPLTSVAHELFHLLGLPHASHGCGGGDNGQTAESWPPDEMGFLQSIGLDVTQGSGPLASFAVIPGGPPLSGMQFFDLMSYCASAASGDPLGLDSWVSVRNWNAIANHYAYHAAAARERPVPVPPLRPLVRVMAFVSLASGTTTITSVRPVRAPVPPAAPADYTVVGRDAAGTQVATAPMRSTYVHVDGGAPQELVLGYLEPSPRIARVDVVRAGHVVATRAASAHAPRVAILAPRAGQRVHGPARIRLRVVDADRDRLTMRVSSSADDGHTWRLVFTGPARASLRLPARYLARARRARLRVEVSDGFHETRLVSRRFRTDGAPPTVRITLPGTGGREPASATLVLAGTAVDDALHPLGGRRLTWRLGRRVLGTGASIAARGLPAGRRRVTLTAVDRYGRAASAGVVVRLTATRPLFLRLDAPRRLRRTARTLRLRIASSVVATLTIRGGVGERRLVVGLRPVSVRLAVRPGRRALQLVLALHAGRLTTIARLTVRRRVTAA